MKVYVMITTAKLSGIKCVSKVFGTLESALEHLESLEADDVRHEPVTQSNLFLTNTHYIELIEMLVL